MASDAGADSSYSGMQCVVISGTSSLFMGTLFNPSSTTQLHVDCPAVTQATNIAFGSFARVVDRHPTQAVECTLFSTYNPSDGSMTFNSAGPVASPGSSTSPQTLQFAGVNAPNTQFSHAFLGCFIPPIGDGQSNLSTYFVKS